MGRRNQGRPRKYGNSQNRMQIKELPIEEIVKERAAEDLNFFKTPKEIKDLDKLDLTKTYYAFSKPTFERLLFLKCNLKEIAAFYNMKTDTLEKEIKKHYGCKYSEIKEQYDQITKASLRKTLYKLASRYPAVAIFLAKNELGMSDNPVNNNLPVINLDLEMTTEESEKIVEEIKKNEQL